MVILTTNCFTYIYFPKFLSLYRYILVAIFFLFLSIKNKNEIRDKLFEKNIIVIFLICPLLSIIPAMMFHNQSFSQSFIAVLNTLPGVLMYWILHKLNPKPKFVIGGLLLMAVVWSSIEAIQQFTYPNYVFGYRAVAEDVIKGTMLDQRNGIWQYKIQPWYIGMIAAFYSWQQLLTSKQNKKLFIFVFIIALCGIYLYMARVVIVSTICMLVYIFILINKRQKMNKARMIFIVCLFAIPIAVNFNNLFGELLDSTQEQVGDYEVDIRSTAAAFYGLEYFPNAVCYILGNGLPHPYSSYGKEIYDIEDIMFLYRADVGLIGDYNIYGAIYIIALVVLFLKVYHYRHFLQPYQVASLLSLFLGSYIMPPFRGNHVFLVLCILYVADYNYNKITKNGKQNNLANI